MTTEIKIELTQNKIRKFDRCNQRWSFEKTNIIDTSLATLIKKIREKILKNNFGDERRQGTINKSDSKNVEMPGTT